MEDHSELSDWELLSDSEANPFEEVIHSNYFAVDSNHPKIGQNPEEIQMSEEKLMSFQPQTGKYGSFPADGAEGSGPSDPKTDLVETSDELGAGDTNEEGAFPADESKGDIFQAGEPKMDQDFEENTVSMDRAALIDSEHEIDASFEGTDAINQNSDGTHDMNELRRESDEEKSQELVGSDSEAANLENVSPGEGENKALIWWKLPFDVLKLCALRMRSIWTLPVAAAVIGILMVGRRLYKLKHRSRRIPLKVSFEDKKVASKILLRATHLNEVLVRRVPVIRSQLLPAGGLSTWPVVGVFSDLRN